MVEFLIYFQYCYKIFYIRLVSISTFHLFLSGVIEGAVYHSSVYEDISELFTDECPVAIDQDGRRFSNYWIGGDFANAFFTVDIGIWTMIKQVSLRNANNAHSQDRSVRL